MDSSTTHHHVFIIFSSEFSHSFIVLTAKFPDICLVFVTDLGSVWFGSWLGFAVLDGKLLFCWWVWWSAQIRRFDVVLVLVVSFFVGVTVVAEGLAAAVVVGDLGDAVVVLEYVRQ
jgi:hypothetical protein